MLIEEAANDGEFFAAIQLDAEHSVTVAVHAGSVVLALLGPVGTTSATLARHEARDVALAVLDASQRIEAEH